MIESLRVFEYEIYTERITIYQNLLIKYFYHKGWWDGLILTSEVHLYVKNLKWHQIKMTSYKTENANMHGNSM